MKKLLISVLVRLLKTLGHVESNPVIEPKPVKKHDDFKDVWFRAVVIVNELNRNAMGYEPKGWQREQLVGKLASEYPWLSGEDVTKIVNGVLL